MRAAVLPGACGAGLGWIHSREQTEVRGGLRGGLWYGEVCRVLLRTVLVQNVFLNIQPQHRPGNALPRFVCCKDRAAAISPGNNPKPPSHPVLRKGESVPGLLLPSSLRRPLGSGGKGTSVVLSATRRSCGNGQGRGQPRGGGGARTPTVLSRFGNDLCPLGAGGRQAQLMPSSPSACQGHQHPRVLLEEARGWAHAGPEQAQLLPSLGGLGTHTAASGSRGEVQQTSPVFYKPSSFPLALICSQSAQGRAW